MRWTLGLLLAGLLFVANPAKANESGFYLGAGIGQANTEVDDDFDENHLGFKVFGGYKFLPWLAVEGIYIDSGEPDISETFGSESASLSFGAQSLVAAVIFSLPIGDEFEVYVKPGFAYWDSKTRFSYSSPSVSYSDSVDDTGTAFFIGAGASWRNGNVGLRLEYEWLEVAPEYNFDTDEFDDDLDASVGFLSLSVVYHF